MDCNGFCVVVHASINNLLAKQDYMVAQLTSLKLKYFGAISMMVKRDPRILVCPFQRWKFCQIFENLLCLFISKMKVTDHAVFQFRPDIYFLNFDISGFLIFLKIPGIRYHNRFFIAEI